MWRSVPQIAAFSTRIMTSFVPTVGTGTSSIQMPGSDLRFTSAFMVVIVMLPVSGSWRRATLLQRGGRKSDDEPHAKRRRGLRSGRGGRGRHRLPEAKTNDRPHAQREKGPPQRAQ